MHPNGPHDDKLRRRIAVEAARLMAQGIDSQRARMRAARRVARGWVPEHQLPSHEEVRGGFGHLVGDRFDRIMDLLRPLASRRRDPTRYPEADALEHALQTFEIVLAERPFDEELLTAALVHDVGTAIDCRDPLNAGLAALDGLITPRTRWFLESLDSAHAYAAGLLGRRARRRLDAHPDFSDIELLASACRQGHSRRAANTTLEGAVQILRDLDAEVAIEESFGRYAVEGGSHLLSGDPPS
jgi:predicted HD phosphohydrolase